MSSSPDVVIVGGGAIGAAGAYELARLGARVTVLERSGDATGCSYGNAGLICPSHADALANLGAVRDGLGWMTRRDSPFRLRLRPALLPWLARFGAAALPARSARATAVLRALARASLERHAALASDGLATGFTRRGTLSVFESRAGFERACDAARAEGATQNAGALAAAGAGGAAQTAGALDPAAPARPLEAAEARELEPALAPGIAGALHNPGDAHCDPGALVRALLGAAAEHGAEVRTGVELLRLRRSNGRIAALDTTTGTLAAGTVVLAAGTWSRALARGAGVHVPLEPAKGYHVEVASGGLAGGIPIYMEEARVIATPLDGRLRLAGTLELAGLDMGVDPLRLASLTRAADRTLALPPGARTVHVWRGLRPCTPDGLPVIGQAPGVENLVLATGHAMLGITLAPVTGELIADVVTGAPPRHDLDPLRPGRFRHRRSEGGRWQP
jgi:D-amino-acid dehydrogenase